MVTITTAATVHLVPVLEVVPFSFSTRPHPPGPAREHAAAWDVYFRDSLADGGYTGVTPLVSGEFFVPARALIGHPLLEHLIREALDGSGLPGFPLHADDLDTTLSHADRISLLAGGLALVIDGEACLAPSCCGDLGNITGWETTIAERPAHGEVWVGHPALAIAWRDGCVTVTEQWEYPPAPEYLLEITMPAAGLAAAVAAARTELTGFHTDLIAIVARLLGDTAQAALVAACLVGAR